MTTHSRPLLGIIAALPGEARSLGVIRCPVGAIVEVADGVRLIRCGMGRIRAERAAKELVRAGAGALLSWGTAAALDGRLCPGNLVLPHQVLAADGRRHSVDQAWREHVAGLLHTDYGRPPGTVAESERVLTDAGDKRRLWDRSHALIADMESGAVAAVSDQAGIRLLVIRAVSDCAAARIPACAVAAVDADGDLRVARCLGKLLLAPGDLVDLLRLGGGYRHACAALSDLAKRAGPRFMLPSTERQAGDGDPQA
jgi:adenosylhomocysteine nucleosidase